MQLLDENILKKENGLKNKKKGIKLKGRIKEFFMNGLEVVTNSYKKQFIEDIIEGVSDICDNSQLMELNKSLNYHTANLIISENPNNVDLNFRKTNSLLIKDFIRSKKLKGLSQNTLSYYDSQLKRVSEWAVKSFIEFNSDDLKDYLRFYQSLRNCSKVSVNNTRRILSSFWRWMEIEEKIIINPMKQIPHIKTPKKVRKAFTDEEVEILRSEIHRHPNKLRNVALFELLLSSGLRLSEVTSLLIDDVSLTECKGIVMGKGGKERVFYFSEKAKVALLEYLESRLDNRPYLFVSGNAPYNRLDQSGVGTVIRQLGTFTGIKNVHPHRFRRTLATRLVRKGMPIEQVSTILGHSSLSVTMRYVENDKELLKLVHKKHTN